MVNAGQARYDKHPAKVCPVWDEHIYIYIVAVSLTIKRQNNV